MSFFDTYISLWYFKNMNVDKQTNKNASSLNVSNKNRTLPALPSQNTSKTEIGDNPTFNLFDMSMRFITKSFVYSRDSYALSIFLTYHSRMPQTISDLCLGLPDGFKTNYHQFLVQDGIDPNQHPVFKYIDGPGYIHSFNYVNDYLYYCSEDEIYLYFDEDSNYYATLVFANKDKMQFDNNGRLVRIENGFDSNNIKTITYNNQGRLSSIIDERKPLKSINFTYFRQKMSKISFYETMPIGNTTILKKRIDLNYDSGFLVNISEEPPVLLFNSPSERSLYNFRYNTDGSLPSSSFDKLEFIEDCLSHDVYKAVYSYVNLYSDYLVSSLIKGYYDNNGGFAAKESIQRIGYSVRTDDWVTTNEVSIFLKDNYFSYSLDKDANITAVFNGLSNDTFSTLYKETGVYIPVSGYNQNTYINGHRFIRLTGPLSIVFNSEAILLLNSYRQFVLRLYLKLNDCNSKRVRANITGTGINSYPCDINVYQFNKYQLVEIPIIRVNNDISSLTVSLSFINEDADPVDVEIGDIYFDKKANTVLKFANGTYSLSQVTAIGIYANYYDQNPSRIIYTDDELVFSSQDLVKTLKHSNNCFNLLYGNTFSPNAHPLYFNNGKVIELYNFRFVLFAGNTIVFDSFNPGNSVLDSLNTWFFETIYPEKTILSSTKDSARRVYYLFDDGDTVVTDRTGTFDNSDMFLTLVERIETHDWNDKLIEVVKSKYLWFGSPLQPQIVSTCSTSYEYFADGELKKVTSLSGNETIVLYSAEKNNDGYICRKTNGLNSVDISYTGADCLENEVKRNIVSGSTISNSLFSRKHNYDYFATDLDSVDFKYNNIVQSTNTFSVDYGNSEALISNGQTTYKVGCDISNDGVEFSVLENNSFNTIYISCQISDNTQITYVNSASAPLTITYERNSYRMMTHQKLNGTNKVDYLYTSGIESPFVNNLFKVVDKYLDVVNGKETSYTYNQIDNSVSSVEFRTVNSSVEFCIDSSYFYNGIIYTFGAFDLSFITKLDETEIRIENPTTYDLYVYTFKVERDGFGRLIKHYSIYSDLYYKAFISDISYNNGTFLPYSFTFGTNNDNGTTIQYQKYIETYSYDSFGNLSAICVAGGTPEFTYSYDGFGRIVSETNAYYSSYNRSYSYDSSGRLSYANNVFFSYDSKGRLISFGNIFLTYDDYGNRLTKGNDSYQWTRGTLLNQITKGGQTYQFTYDYQGRRYQKKIGSLTISYYYHDNRLIGESRSDGKEIRYLYDETGIVGFDYYNGISNNTYRYIKNPFNQIVGIVDNLAEIVAKYIYDAWGNHIVVDALDNEITDLTNIGHVNPIRYKGYYYDVETGLYYLFSRYYDPSVMQFISPDDYSYLNVQNISGYHLYAYCHNNPIEYLDEFGHFPVTIGLLLLGLGIGAVLGASASVVTQGLTNGWDNINVLQVLLDAGIGGISGMLSFSGIGAWGMAFTSGVLGFIGSIGSDLIASKGDWSSVNLIKAGVLGGVYFALGRFAGAGVQNKAIIGNILYKTSNSYRVIMNATIKYGTGSGFRSTWNLYGGRLLTEIAIAMPSIIAGRMFIATSTMASTALSMTLFNWGADTYFDWW